MGYFPDLVPSLGGSGIVGVNFWCGWANTFTVDFSGNLISVTLPSDTEVVQLQWGDQLATLGTDVFGWLGGGGVIDCSANTFSYSHAGARQNWSTAEQQNATTVTTLSSSLPYTIFTSNTAYMQITNYSGPGNTFTIYGWLARRTIFRGSTSDSTRFYVIARAWPSPP